MRWHYHALQYCVALVCSMQLLSSLHILALVSDDCLLFLLNLPHVPATSLIARFLISTRSVARCSAVRVAVQLYQKAGALTLLIVSAILFSRLPGGAPGWIRSDGLVISAYG